MHHVSWGRRSNIVCQRRLGEGAPAAPGGGYEGEVPVAVVRHDAQELLVEAVGGAVRTDGGQALGVCGDGLELGCRRANPVDVRTSRIRQACLVTQEASYICPERKARVTHHAAPLSPDSQATLPGPGAPLSPWAPP